MKCNYRGGVLPIHPFTQSYMLHHPQLPSHALPLGPPIGPSRGPSWNLCRMLCNRYIPVVLSGLVCTNTVYIQHHHHHGHPPPERVPAAASLSFIYPIPCIGSPPGARSLVTAPHIALLPQAADSDF